MSHDSKVWLRFWSIRSVEPVEGDDRFGAPGDIWGQGKRLLDLQHLAHARASKSRTYEHIMHEIAGVSISIYVLLACQSLPALSRTHPSPLPLSWDVPSPAAAPSPAPASRAAPWAPWAPAPRCGAARRGGAASAPPRGGGLKARWCGRRLGPAAISGPGSQMCGKMWRCRLTLGLGPRG